jgi:hypothetical protein
MFAICKLYTTWGIETDFFFDYNILIATEWSQCLQVKWKELSGVANLSQRQCRGLFLITYILRDGD